MDSWQILHVPHTRMPVSDLMFGGCKGEEDAGEEDVGQRQRISFGVQMEVTTSDYDNSIINDDSVGNEIYTRFIPDIGTYLLHNFFDRDVDATLSMDECSLMLYLRMNIKLNGCFRQIQMMVGHRQAG